MTDIKRLNYFNQQFLVDTDFNDEQAYHRQMRLRHNMTLHTWGVADGGFAVSVTTGSTKSVTVSTGIALDNLGQEIILLSPQALDLSGFTPNSDIYITIQYQEAGSDFSTASGVPQNTRWTESPKLQAVTTAPPSDGSVIALARVHLDGNGNIPPANIDPGIRAISSSKISPAANLQVGSLSVSGKVGIGSTGLNYPLSFGGSLANTKLAIWDGGPSGVAFGLGVQNSQFRFHLNQPSDRFSFLNSANGTELFSIMGGGNIGIGMAAPTAKLHIGGGAPGLRVEGPSSPGGTTVSIGGNGDLAIDAPGIAGGRFIVKDGGNVGIGTISPMGPLQINASATPPSGLGGGNNGLLLGSAGESQYKWIQSYNGPLSLNPVGNNVGIGTTAPAYKLHIGAGNLGLRIEGPAAAGGTAVSLGGYGDLSIDSPGIAGGRFIVKDSGNVGIGTANPGMSLEVTKTSLWGSPAIGGSVGSKHAFLHISSGDHSLIWDNGAAMRFGTETGLGSGYTELMRIGANGYVGIGTSTPATKLDVVGGNIKWGNYSILQPDQGGSIELGGDNSHPGTGIPYIDFHISGQTQDFNTRIINDADGQMTVYANNIHLHGLNGRTIDLITNYGATDLISSTDLYINNNNLTTYIKNYKVPSSRELKENIHTFSGDEAMRCLTEMNAVFFNYKDDLTKNLSIGFIAEDTPTILASSDRKAIVPMHIIAMLTRVAQEQQKMIHSLQQEIESLNLNKG